MRSCIKFIALVAMTAFMIVADAHQGQPVDGLVVRSLAGGNKFKDMGYNALSTLAEGPYPSALSAIKSLPPMVPGTSGSGSLQKRQQCNCGTGFGCCGNGKCCPTDQLCSVSTGGCCDKQFPYTCGGKYCCPYAMCTTDGYCGCRSAAESRCGDNCCLYGCDGNTCACPKAFPVACTIYSTCCPEGTVCAGPGKCASANTTTTSTTSLPTSSSTTSTASNVVESSGSIASANSLSPSAASSMERSGAMVALMVVVTTLLLV
ncbi:hypothetical protein EDD21DRAFT_439579 [Dissophora ornata]|nr:hypothetical protein EDD21DRAFT_439579 [Dissophora ornata]